MPAIPMPALARLALLVPMTLLLSAFHGFVGWHKVFSSREELMRHTAWTVHLPEWLGRLVGITELALTLLLLLALFRPGYSRIGMMAAYGFIALELVSTVTHQLAQDGASLVQNLLSIFITAVVAWLFAQRAAAAR